MCDSKKITLLAEGVQENHINTLHRTYLLQHRRSFGSSNTTSDILLKDVWRSNSELFNETATETILNSAKALLQTADMSHTKTWKSSLSNFTDPETILERSLPKCLQCSDQTEYKMTEHFQNKCNCDLGIKQTSIAEKSLEKPIDVKTLSESSSQESKSDEKQLFRPKFGRSRPKNQASTSKNLNRQTYSNPDRCSYQENHSHVQENSIQIQEKYSSNQEKYSSIQEIDLQKEEEENKAHKSNVAKITFKTAKEQLLASNPAAKRTLGASRKAQGKFVSPMLGAQDKQETSETENAITDERLKNIDPKMIELIENEIIDKGNPVSWDDIAGLQMAKSVIQEAVVWPLLRPDIFTGLRRPPKGILLFGPPGTGKTLIGKCIAAQCNATFFSISASSLTSKWIGDGEKMVRALFAVARCHQPAVIFIDEIDSLLTQRSDTEHEATRRIKTEFLVQFDGAATGDEDRLLIVGATNRPQELDEAARRRLVKRLYIPLPDVEARKQMIANLLSHEQHSLSPSQVSRVASMAEGHSGADVRSLCAEAAMGPVRAVPLNQIATIQRDQVRPVCLQDFLNALQRVRPSVSQDDLGQYVKWNNTYGQGV